MKFEKKSGSVAWLAWTAAAIFYLYEYAVRIAPSVMERELALEFVASAATMGAVLGSYYLVYAPLQLFAGLLFDRFGGKKVLVPASILVSIGCLCTIIPTRSLVYVTIGRILAGVGSSCAFIGVMYLAAVWFHENKLAFLSGLTTSLGICGAILGQAPLSVLIDRSGWRISLVLLAIVGLVTSVIIYLFVPQTPRWEREKRFAKADRSSLRHFVVGLISVCRNKQTWIIGLVASCLYMPTVVFGDLWGIQYVQSSLNLPKAAAAKVSSMLYIGWLIGGPIMGLVSDLIKCRRKLLILGSFLSTIFFSVVLICPIRSPFVVGTLLFLAGISSSPQVICFVASLEANVSNAKGSAISVINMIVMFVGGIFQPIVGWLMGKNFTGDMEHVISHIAFRNALLTIPILTFIGLLLSLFVKKGINGENVSY
ncbi:MAG: MFS transporter [Puniceicoccales bacterium]|jgi:MFS family permease|nr:MFS transporter [Puniceicoccales bacterium]